MSTLRVLFASPMLPLAQTAEPVEIDMQDLSPSQSRVRCIQAVRISTSNLGPMFTAVKHREHILYHKLDGVLTYCTERSWYRYTRESPGCHYFKGPLTIGHECI